MNSFLTLTAKSKILKLANNNKSLYTIIDLNSIFGLELKFINSLRDTNIKELISINLKPHILTDLKSYNLMTDFCIDFDYATDNFILKKG